MHMERDSACFAKSLGPTIQPARKPGIECDFDKLLIVTT